MTKIYRIKLTELKKLFSEGMKLSQFAKEVAEPIIKDIEKLIGKKIRFSFEDEYEAVYKTNASRGLLLRALKKVAKDSSRVGFREYADGMMAIVFVKAEDDEDNINKLDERLYNEQYEEIKKAYGKTAAEKANYGWGAVEGSVATKVYLKSGYRVLTSTYDPEGPEDQFIEHEWDERDDKE
ncbi:MAG: hypothetical protein WC460_06705 [Patescibacteria group bacterium]